MSELIIEDHTFSTDAPIDEPGKDRFQRWPFAQRLARTIASRRDPGSIVIGIYGAWGDGKTSVMNFIHRELAAHEQVIVVRFNPWLFGTETQIIQNFFQVMAAALGKSLSTYKEKVGDWLEKYGSVFASPFSIGDGVKDVGKALNAADVDDYRERIEKLLQEQRKRVVIFMDDIDRLDKTEIQTVFKLVKLTGDFAYTSYVLAFDEEMVASALSEKYGSGSIEAGRNFLEKIVQVPLHLPVADIVALRKYCFEAVDEALELAEITLTNEQTESFVYNFVEGIQNRLHTPRMAKRYGNALTFALPILKGEVNPVDLMLVEGIRIFYPRLYEHIRVNPDLYLGKRSSYGMLSPQEDQEGQELLKRGLEGLSKSDRKCAEALLKSLFPSVDAILRNGSNWPQASSNALKEKRVHSAPYFSRYFLYAVPDSDVSDAKISSFFEELEMVEADEAVYRLEMMMDGHDPNKFIQKLRQFEEELSPQASEVLAKTLGRFGHRLPDEGEFLSFLTPYNQSAILVVRLLKNVPTGLKRLEAGEDVLRIAELGYAVACFRWMYTEKEEGDDENSIYSVDEKKHLDLIIVQRIKELAEKEILYLTQDKPAELLFTWADRGSREETNQYLQHTFEQEEIYVLHFLKHCLNRSRSLGSKIERLSDFRRDNYDALQRIVDVNLIFSALKRLFGDVLDDPNYERFHNDPTDLQIAMQFAYVHNQAVKEHSSN